MRKPLAIIAALCGLTLVLSGCFDDKAASEVVFSDLKNAVVTSFSLRANTDVAAGLENVAFTIDDYGQSDAELHALYPNDGIIFNPDSLPYGTLPDSIKVKVSYNSPSAVKFYMYKAGELRRVMDYANDSALFFASYPDCRLEITSSDGTVKRVYHVKVNVHKTIGDSIIWHNYPDGQAVEAWNDVARITDQRVDTLGTTLYWLAEYDGASQQVKTASLLGAMDQWSAAAALNVEGSALLNLQSVVSWNTNLFAVGKTDGKLYASEDGKTWVMMSDAYQFVNVLGVLESHYSIGGMSIPSALYTILKDGDVYYAASTKDGSTWSMQSALPSNFPISGYVRPISVGANRQGGNRTSRLYVVGGKDASGNLQPYTWSCDGGVDWVNISSDLVPPAMTGASVVRYTLDSEHPHLFWLLYPGRLADGSVASEIYFSRDCGISWHRLKRYFPKYADISHLVPVACNSAFYEPNTFNMYYFGGQRADGSWTTQVFGGVLNSLNYEKVR